MQSKQRTDQPTCEQDLWDNYTKRKVAVNCEQLKKWQNKNHRLIYGSGQNVLMEAMVRIVGFNVPLDIL